MTRVLRAICAALTIWQAAGKSNAMKNRPLCTNVRLPGAKEDNRIEFEVGGEPRCANVLRPTAPRSPAEGPMPIVLWFHAAGGQAGTHNCVQLGRVGLQNGFTVVCAEALQGAFGPDGGHWSLPEIVTDATGNNCNAELDIPPSRDLAYVKQVLAILEEEPTEYNVSRVFPAGCSMGSQFAMFFSTCLKDWSPTGITAFATHASGLKVKGDQLTFPDNIYRPQYEWGECPECQYAPIKPMPYGDGTGSGLKACVFDTVDDSPDFYWSSMQLAEKWYQLGNKVELHVQDRGGHCDAIDLEKMVKCLDDGTGLLMKHRETLSSFAPKAHEAHDRKTLSAFTPKAQDVKGHSWAATKLAGK